MSIVCPDVQKGGTQIVLNMLETQGDQDDLFMSSNTRQVPSVL